MISLLTRYQTVVLRSFLIALPGLLTFCAPAPAATFGTVVSIGGQASDIALDENRRALYIANFGAARIDVLSLDTNSIARSINVAPEPAALALSPDGKYLFIAHFGNFAPPAAVSNSITVLNLADNSRRVFGLGAAPLGVAFGIDNQALVVTPTEFVLIDPASGQTRTLDSVAGLTAKSLPVPAPTFPSEIVAASLTASGDGLWIYGLTDTFIFKYNVTMRQLSITGYVSSPKMGPRTVSVSRDGSHFTAGWALFDARGTMMAQFPNPSGKLNVGSHAIDSEAGVIYAQVTEAASSQNGASSPAQNSTVSVSPTAHAVLQVVAGDNLTVLDRLQLAENLAGRSVLNSARTILYSVSDSGVTVLPVGNLSKARRVRAEQSDLVFLGTACNPQKLTQDVAIVDGGGNQTSFSLVPSNGVSVNPSSGVTPTVVHVTIDPGAFASAKGTSVGKIEIRSADAINVTEPIRVLVNNREPDQRGMMLNIPGKLVDILADPARNRFFALRQNTNEVLVFDQFTYKQTAALRTGNTPMQMAMTTDRKYLLVSNDNSQIASTFDLDTLEASAPIRFPFGHYPRSIAIAGNTILASVRSAGTPHTIDRIDWVSGTAYTPATLGVYTNDVDINTVLTASPNGSSILAAMPNGKVMLYDANADTFIAARQDFQKLSGAYAASSYQDYVVDNNILNSSLVPVGTLENQSGSSSGFLFTDRFGFRTTSSTASPGAGMIQRVNVSQGATVLPTRMTEAPLLGPADSVFTRTLAVLGNRAAIASLTTSGFTILPWNYDAAYAPPRIDRVVNAANGSESVAPGSLITVLGSQLSPITTSTDPTMSDALSDSCLSVNGVVTPVVFASSERINAQLPFNIDGTATLILRTPGGASDGYRLQILPAAPGVFMSGTAGPDTGIATVVRAVNNQLVTNSNPIHPGDDIVIYATGLGRTIPEVPAGTPAPYEPLAYAAIPPKLTLGGVDLGVYFAGLAPGLIGVYQINALVPRSVPTGFDMPLKITQDGQSTTLGVRVVR